MDHDSDSQLSEKQTHYEVVPPLARSLQWRT